MKYEVRIYIYGRHEDTQVVELTDAERDAGVNPNWILEDSLIKTRAMAQTKVLARGGPVTYHITPMR
mgnify:CR=1 FL=1